MIILNVCMITYNHENYICEAIESVIMQQTSFKIELIIGEDCSTDTTRIKCEEYAIKYPQLVRLIPAEKNLGMMHNFIRTLDACNGKYIAICEGDDYWTDPLKLQKQVDFMEANPEYSFVFHNALIKYEGKRIKDDMFCKDEVPDTTDVTYHIGKFRVPTASIVLRREFIMELPEWFKYIYNGDYALILFAALTGKAKYLNEIMSVYRKTPGGLNARGKNSDVWFKMYEMLSYFDLYTNFKYHLLILKRKDELRHWTKLSLNAEKTLFEKLTSCEYYYRKLKRILK